MPSPFLTYNPIYALTTGAGTSTTATSTVSYYAGDILLATVDQPYIDGAATGTPTTHYIHPDHLGSTNVTSDESGNTVEWLQYAPYGAVITNTGTSTSARQYIGQFTDDTGLSYLHDVTEGTHMELFLSDFAEEFYEPREVPEELQVYCLDQEDGRILCPKLFNRLDIGNYLNHSQTPNLRYEKGNGYFALRDIKKGEELFADYRQLGEPEETWAPYYEARL